MKKIKLGLLPKIIIAIILGIGAGTISPDMPVRVFVTFNSLFSEFLGFLIPLIIGVRSNYLLRIPVVRRKSDHLPLTDIEQRTDRTNKRSTRHKAILHGKHTGTAKCDDFASHGLYARTGHSQPEHTIAERYVRRVS